MKLSKKKMERRRNWWLYVFCGLTRGWLVLERTPTWMEETTR